MASEPVYLCHRMHYKWRYSDRKLTEISSPNDTDGHVHAAWVSA